MFLQSRRERECVAGIVMLEDVESAIEGDFPAVVGDDVASMNGGWFFELVGEHDADRMAVNSYLIQKIGLLVRFEVVRDSD